MAMYGYGYQYPQFYPNMYGQPVQDNLAQLRQQQITPAQATMSAGGDDRIWIQGEVGAKAYIVAPGNTVTLWDSESQTIYVKSVNGSGVPSMQVYRYTPDEPKPAEIPLDKYVTKEEFEKRIKEIMEEKKDDVQ